ncbi:MAG: mRNA surveillance protein pelota [Nanoarchaeota archaeon]|nr:mRNA surveillance protein pelota [Nanoarchaeota archaeon]
MKQLSSERGKHHLKVDTQDDLWYLSQIIDSGDFVSGKTLRKMKTGTQDDRTQKAAKVPVFIKIQVEKVEWGDTLRVLGRVVEGPEDLSHGEHHSFVLEPHTEFTLEKQRWLSYQKEKLEEACAQQQAPILIAVHDREEAYLAVTKRSGYELVAHLQGKVAKKGMDSGTLPNFYEEIIQKLAELTGRLKPSVIVIASPAFWKEDLMKHLPAEMRKNVVLATCSSVGKEAIDEVLKREEVKTALSADRTTKELKLVEALLKALATTAKVAYGEKEVARAVEAGAIEELLVTDGFIKEKREANLFEPVEQLLKEADSQKAPIHVISSKNDAGMRLDGLGGIAAMLRYRLS